VGFGVGVSKDISKSFIGRAGVCMTCWDCEGGGGFGSKMALIR